MFDPIQWLDDCEAALVDADTLASWLVQSRSGDAVIELDSLRIRIAVLRAELQRARVELSERVRIGSGAGSDPSPWAGKPAPWTFRSG